MIGQLPTSLEVGGKDWEIRSDFRNILCVFEALEDDGLTDSEKLYVTLLRIYVNFEGMPQSLYKEAYEQASKFMECHERGKDKSKHRLINWQKDEHMIFPAINAVAGCEVRSIQYMHWWTFLGYFENIDNESLWSFVISIRQKRANGKKLEKHEQEFFSKNQDLCAIEWKAPTEKVQDQLSAIFDSLSNE